MVRTIACLRSSLAGGIVAIGICGAITAAYSVFFIQQVFEYPPLVQPDNVCISSSILFAMGLLTCVISWCNLQFMDLTNKSQILTFAVLLGIIAFIEAVAGIWALSKHERTDEMQTVHYRATLPAPEEERFCWDRMQSVIGCCGINGTTDYENNGSIPASCCNASLVSDSNGYSNGSAPCESVFDRGCLGPMISRTRSILLRIFLLALCSVLCQVGLIILISCYVRSFDERIIRRRQASIIASRAYKYVREQEESRPES